MHKILSEHHLEMLTLVSVRSDMLLALCIDCNGSSFDLL